MLRASAYQGADIVLLCFPVADLSLDRQALERKLKVFTEEATKFTLAVILVGTKKDLAEAEKSTTTQGWDLAKALSAQEYLECSAISSHDDVKELFKHVIAISKSRPHNTLFVSDKKSSEASSESLSDIEETDDNRGIHIYYN